MQDLLSEILSADSEMLSTLLIAAVERFKILYPDWELQLLSLPKGDDRNELIDRVILLLENLKTDPSLPQPEQEAGSSTKNPY